MKALTFLLTVLTLMAGCTIDNYSKPDITLSGKIVDSQTGELVPSSGANAGTIVKLYEGNAVQPLFYNTNPDGTFENTRVFPATYRIAAEGAFDMAEDTMLEKITQNAQIEIKVIPNVRIKLTLTKTADTTAELKVEYEKVNASQQMIKLGVVWSTYENPNATVFPEGNIILDDVSSEQLTKGNRTYSITNLKPGETYYVRALAQTNNAGAYYNYSASIEIKTP